MEGIISCKTSASSTVATLPKFKKLSLSDLPSLTSIYHGKLVFDSLCVMEIDDCPNLKKLPFLINKERPLGIRIVVSEEWWERLEWEDANLKELLQPFLDPEASRSFRLPKYQLKQTIKKGLWSELDGRNF
ncbi:disease resistance protein UNI-like [Dioscorea cayenensis subsp. rotundata]|uniref:Disease resistance protein UNI-like n=1 Tax=Dioscorea cayennensis subsp. rotundata TaxID=55577 RepID=A0AB40BIY2_DIOCR|nr:disease resistance protein UNI-like [Dioscorea cayenensis subsp. rotundata]